MIFLFSSLSLLFSFLFFQPLKHFSVLRKVDSDFDSKHKNPRFHFDFIHFVFVCLMGTTRA